MAGALPLPAELTAILPGVQGPLGQFLCSFKTQDVLPPLDILPQPEGPPGLLQLPGASLQPQPPCCLLLCMCLPTGL